MDTLSTIWSLIALPFKPRLKRVLITKHGHRIYL